MASDKNRPYHKRGDVPSKELLERWYLVEKKSASEIGALASAKESTVINWLRKNDIAIRTNQEAQLAKSKVIPEKEWLAHEYLDQGKSTNWIASELGIGEETIRKWLIRYGIPRRELNKGGCTRKQYRGKDWRSKGWLYDQYVVQQKSIAEIAKNQNVSDSCVSRLLKKHGILTRDPKTSEEVGMYRRHPNLWNKEWITEQYIEKAKTVKQIADEEGVCAESVRQSILRNGLPMRTNVERNRLLWSKYDFLTKELLTEEYVNNNKSAIEIAHKFGITADIVRKRMVRHDVKRRPLQEAQKKGAGHHSWKGGISPIRGKIYSTPEWKNAVRIVRKRDKDLCRWCEFKGNIVKAECIHHIDPFTQALLFACDPGNLIQLCEECHYKMRGKEKRWMRKLFKLIESPICLST